MGCLRGIAVGAALTALSLAAAPAAGAATMVGSDCAAINSIANKTLVQLVRSPAASATPVAVPIHGVVTRWGVNAPAGFAGPLTERLKILRPTTVSNQFLVVAESVGGVVHGGPNQFETRIPVEAGDRFGAHGVEGTFYCETGDAGNTMGFAEGDPSAGLTVPFNSVGSLFAAVSAFVEPDADQDGYGDETQDRCPSSAAFQAACPPPLSLSVTSQTGKSAVKILVATSAEAPVKVAGTVSFSKKPARAAASARVKLKAPAKTVKPGQIAAFKLKLPGSLKSALAATPAGKSLKLEVTVSASNATGVPAAKDLVVKLKGRGG